MADTHKEILEASMIFLSLISMLRFNFCIEKLLVVYS